MKATNTAYNFSDSLSRIDEILNAPNTNYEEKKSIPTTGLTYNNGYYVECIALFVIAKNKTPKRPDVPFFSKVALHNVALRLQLIGYKYSVIGVHYTFDGSDKDKKKRNRNNNVAKIVTE